MGTITGNGTAQTGLGGPAGYGETALPRNDDGTYQADVSAVFEDGFLLGGTTYDADEFFISTDGFVTFGAPTAELTDNPAAMPMPFIAVFSADVDTRLDGEGAESGQIWLDVDTAQDCVTITWDDVGFYRRNATETNTFQLQLFDRGGGTMDVVFRYEDIDWTSGDLEGGFGGLGGDPAFIGYSESSGTTPTTIGASGSQSGQIALPTTTGNTGVPGLYVFRLGESLAPIEGGAGNDIIEGTVNADLMFGYGGDDRMFGSAGADTMDGGTGRDTADYSTSTKGFKLDLLTPSDSTGYAIGDVLLGFEVYVGSAYNDTMITGTTGTRLEGGGGNDTLRGNNGNDSLYGGIGSDSSFGGGGDDVIDGGDGPDTLSGEAGNDQLFGGVGNDSLLGGDGNDQLVAGDGNDTLNGADGNDTARGGQGDDRLDMGAGNDSLLGEGGNDTMLGGDGNDTLNGGKGNDSMFGGAGSDRLDGKGGADTLNGGDTNDSSINYLYGAGGDDLLYGGGFSDELDGGKADDALYGGGGNDTLDGGTGVDTLTGGLGADQFFTASKKKATGDWITDYSSAQQDVLVFGKATAVADDFTVTEVTIAGAGLPGVKEVEIRYGKKDQLIWVLEDGAASSTIMVQSGSNEFDLLA